MRGMWAAHFWMLELPVTPSNWNKQEALDISNDTSFHGELGRFNRRSKLMMPEIVRRTICIKHEGRTAGPHHDDGIAAFGRRRGALLGSTCAVHRILRQAPKLVHPALR